MRIVRRVLENRFHRHRFLYVLERITGILSSVIGILKEHFDTLEHIIEW
jgi:hypothetical protein